MSPEHDEPDEVREDELYEDVPPRSIFAATWFRVVLVVIVLGVIGAVAVPYVLDWMNPPPPPRTAVITNEPLAPPASTPAPTPGPGTDSPTGDKPAAETKDSTLIPAPAAPAPASPSKPAAPSSKPAPSSSEARGKAAGTESPGKTPTPPTEGSKTAAATKPSPPRPTTTKATTPTAPTASGPFWVQVGAFKDAETAKRVAAKLRDENFKVEESVKRAGGSAPSGAAAPPKASPAPSASDQYDVFVTGISAEELNKRLSGKGLSAGTSGNGVVVTPSLPLRDAVALSKDLAVEGFKVQVRRAGGAAAPEASAPAAAVDGPTLHRVRVGAFSDRAAAQAAARDLEAKGYKPFIARGDR